MENRTLSQMHGILYLPMFLLRVGLLIVMYIASLMALAIFWPSLLIILKCSTVVAWSVICWCSNFGHGAYKCSLYHSSEVLDDFPIYSSSHSVLPHLNQYIMLLCLVIVSLSFGNINRFFKVFPPLKCTWAPYLLQTFSSCLVGVVLPCFLLFSVLLSSCFCKTLSMAHFGYLH